MTSRYSRRTVPAVSRGLPEDFQHPPPDYDVEPSVFPSSYYDSSIGDPTHSHYETGRSRSPSQSSHGWTSMPESTIGGATTVRSSVWSLADDELDRETTKRVALMFEGIDAILFEHSKFGPKHLLGECEEWAGNFPHLRILGKQLVPSQESGYRHYPSVPSSLTAGVTATPATMTPGVTTPASRGSSSRASGLSRGLYPSVNTTFSLEDISETSITASHNMHELSVTGQHVDASLPSERTFSSYPSTALTPYTQEDEEEEIIEQDGSIEDIFAVDFSPDDDVKSTMTTKRSRRRGLPPMTPQACVRDNLQGATFDFIWAEFISWLRPVHSQLVPDGAELPLRGVGTRLDDLEEDGQSTPRQFTDLGTSPPAASARVISSRSGPMRLLNREGYGTTHEDSPLDNVLLIHPMLLKSKQNNPKALLSASREQSNIQDSMDQFPPTTQRPSSSLVRSAAPMGRPNSVRGRTGARGRLQAIPVDRGKTPSMQTDERHFQDAIIMGHRLTTPNDMASPLPVLARNGILPPIEREASDTTADYRRRMIPTGPQRASSAVHDKENRATGPRSHLQTYREASFKEPPTAPLAAHGLADRPSTTHAFRSDSFGHAHSAVGTTRRSSTPQQGFTGHRTALHTGQSPALGNIPQGQPALTYPAPVLNGPIVSSAAGLNPLHHSGHHSTAGTGAAPVRSVQMSITGSSINPHADATVAEEGGLISEPFEDLVQASQWDPNYMYINKGLPTVNYINRPFEGTIHSRRSKPPHFNTAVR